ncbi:MAG: pantetheine-phosphate adenylyltransferase [Sphingomonas fennica]
MRCAVYPGTFDPIHRGHIDIATRAARLADRLVVGVTTNPAKTPLFALDERIALIRTALAGAGGDIVVEPFEGLIVDFAGKVGAQAIVRGLRTGSDFDYEAQMAALNGTMAPAIETIFLTAAPALHPVSSSFVREIGRAGGPIEALVTPPVAAAVRERIAALR